MNTGNWGTRSCEPQNNAVTDAQKVREGITLAYEARIDNIVQNYLRNNMTKEAMIDWLDMTHKDYKDLMRHITNIEGFINSGNPFTLKQ